LLSNFKSADTNNNAIKTSENKSEKKSENTTEKKSEKKSNELMTPLIVDKLPSTSDTYIRKESLSAVSTLSTCGCASLVKCPPCGIVLFQEDIVNCPCAPKPTCPVCPPMSKIHELAAKKAIEDERKVNNIRGITDNINKVLDNIKKYSENVYKFETKAKEMAQKMEESGKKASEARSNMVKVKKNIILVK
jgi:hypothetical protein